MSIPLVSRKLIYGKCFALVLFFFFLVPFFFFDPPLPPTHITFFLRFFFFCSFVFSFFFSSFLFLRPQKRKEKFVKSHTEIRGKEEKEPTKSKKRRFSTLCKERKEKKRKQNKNEGETTEEINFNPKPKAEKHQRKDKKIDARFHRTCQNKKKPILGEKGQKGKKKKIRRQGLRVHPQKRKKRKCSKTAFFKKT